MKVELIGADTDFGIDYAIGMCYDKGCYIDSEKKINRIKKVALKDKHASVLEFANFTFRITASTKVLLEMTRHRMASYACKSSRYTLNKGELVFEPTGNEHVDNLLEVWKSHIEECIEMGMSNEITSLMLPQAYQYVWLCQFNARSLKNFLHLRTAPSAHFMIREVAQAMYEALSEEIKYIFEGDIHD